MSSRGMRGAGGKWVPLKGQQEGTSWWKKCSGAQFYHRQHPACDIVPILQDVSMRGNWVKGTWDLSILSCNYMWMYSYLKIKSLILKKPTTYQLIIQVKKKKVTMMLSFRIGKATVKSAPPTNCKTKTDPQQFLLSWCRTPHSPSCSRDDLTVRNEQVCPKINESNGIILWRMIRSQSKNPRCQVSCFLPRAMSMFAVIWVWTPRLQSHFSVNSDRTGQKLSSPVFL